MRRTLGAAAAGALAGAVAAWAVVHAFQQDSDRERRRRPREEVFRMVDAYFLDHLQQRLELTEDQAARLSPLVKRLQTDRRELAHRRGRAMQELRRVLVSGGATEARVQELLSEIKTVEAEEPARLRRDLEAIDAVLTPVQQAKYRLLEAEMERRVRQALTRMRGPRPPHRKRPRDPEDDPPR